MSKLKVHFSLCFATKIGAIKSLRMTGMAFMTQNTTSSFYKRGQLQNLEKNVSSLKMQLQFDSVFSNGASGNFAILNRIIEGDNVFKMRQKKGCHFENFECIFEPLIA